MVAGITGSIATQTEATEVRNIRNTLSSAQQTLKATHGQMKNASGTLESLYKRLSDVQVEAGSLGRQLMGLNKNILADMHDILMTNSQLESQLKSVDLAIQKFNDSGALRHAASFGRRFLGTTVAEQTRPYANEARQQFSRAEEFQTVLASTVETIENIKTEVESALTELAQKKDELSAAEYERSAKEMSAIEITTSAVELLRMRENADTESLTRIQERLSAANQEVQNAQQVVNEKLLSWAEFKISLNRS